MNLDETSIVQRACAGHKAAVNAVSFDSEYHFATGSDDSTVRVWDLRTQKPQKCMLGCFQGQAVDSVTFSKHGGPLLYAAAGQHIYSFDLRKEGVLDREPLLALRACADGSPDTEVECLEVHPSGDSLLMGDSDGVITILDSASFEMKAQLSGVHSSIITSLSVDSPEGHLLVSGALDYTLCKWDLLSGQPAASPVSFNGLSSRLQQAAGGGEGDGMGQMINPPFVHGASFVCGGQCVLSVNGDGSVNLFDTDSLELLASAREAHASMIGALHVADEDGTSFLTGANDKVVQAWIVTQEEEGQLALSSLWKLLHVEKINAIAGPPGGQPFDGRPFVVADTSPEVKIYAGAN